MAIVKGNIFTFKGVTDVSDCKTAQDVMIKANLNWTVQKTQVYAKMPGQVDFDNPDNLHDTDIFVGSNSFKPVNNSFCTYRTDINQPLGMVKDRYTPVQNMDAFKFFNDAISDNNVSWFTAGCYGIGEKIFVSAKLSDTVLVNGKDPIENYLVFSTSHDGSSGVRIMLTPIRLICFNCMNAAIRNASNYITLRHTQSVHTKINKAKEILGIARKKIDFFEECMEQMTKIKFSDKEAMELFGQVLLNDNELTALAQNGYEIKDIVNRNWLAMDRSNISTQKANELYKMYEYYHIGAGQQEFLGTGYGVYNAVNGYYSNLKNEEGIKRMDTLLNGTQSNKIALAGNLILS